MGIRGELYTTQVTLANRSYFFNVKENRTGDVFLQIVESKNQAEDRDRHQIAVFEEDMQKFFSGLDDSLKFIQKNKKERGAGGRQEMIGGAPEKKNRPRPPQ